MSQDKWPTPQPHPIKSVLATRRVTITALGLKIGCNRNNLGRVINGFMEPWPALRRRCAEYLALPEEELFHAPDRVSQ
jgi:flagellar biosynthesis/type III secretory pathway ATPase